MLRAVTNFFALIYGQICIVSGVILISRKIVVRSSLKKNFERNNNWEQIWKISSKIDFFSAGWWLRLFCVLKLRGSNFISLEKYSKQDDLTFFKYILNCYNSCFRFYTIRQTQQVYGIHDNVNIGTVIQFVGSTVRFNLIRRFLEWVPQNTCLHLYGVRFSWLYLHT